MVYKPGHRSYGQEAFLNFSQEYYYFFFKKKSKKDGVITLKVTNFHFHLHRENDIWIMDSWHYSLLFTKSDIWLLDLPWEWENVKERVSKVEANDRGWEIEVRLSG